MTTTEIIQMVNDPSEFEGTIRRCEHDILALTHKEFTRDHRINTCKNEKLNLQNSLLQIDSEILSLKSVCDALPVDTDYANDIRSQMLKLEVTKYDLMRRLELDQYELLAYHVFQLNAIREQRENTEDFVKRLSRKLKRMEQQTDSGQKTPAKKSKAKKAA